MEETKKFGGFDSVIDTFLPLNQGNETIMDPEDIEREMEKLDFKDTTEEKEESDETKEEVKIPKKSSKPEDKSVEKDEKEKSEKEDDKNSTKSSVKSDEEEYEEVEYEEADLVDAFSDLFAEKLGWKYEKDEKPKSVEELIDYMQGVIDNNSQPRFANDDVKEINEYVEKGGKLEDLYKAIYKSDISIDDLDLTNELNQKSIIKENLRNRDYSEQRIEKLISRYEEQGALEEEAKDSLEEVKEYREKTKTQLLERQKKVQAEEIKAQHEFVQNVEKIVTDSQNIRGIELSSKEKEELLEYIFKPDRDGMTKYQKDYNANLKNLVESAYFTMKGDKLVQEIQKKATSEATKGLKLKLRTKGKSTKNTESETEDNNSKVTQLWEIASSALKSF